MRPRSRLVLLALAVAGMVATLLAPESSADAHQQARVTVGRDAFVPGQVYQGDFPDPTVLRVGSTYYAYATSVSGLNLPVVQSTDLRTWSVEPMAEGRLSPDALPQVPAWAAGKVTADGRTTAMTWAPSVARVAGRYVAAYSVRVRGFRNKMCISVAVAPSPTGPFVDSTTRPLVCPANRGAIDPQIYREQGKLWLLYKTEDISIGKATRLWIRELAPGGTSFAPGTHTHLLLRARDNWERRTVEGPAMVRFHRKRYLIYSAGGWANPSYAIGYATCPRVIGPCRRVPDPVRKHPRRRHHHKPRPTYSPLLASGNGISSPGGGTPFVTPDGRLRMAYHAWDQGRIGYQDAVTCLASPAGCAQRKMHVATLRQVRQGRLRVVSLGLT